jgi:Tfp pilus assembly protein PilX
MKKAKFIAAGFTLIASLLLLIVLSGMALALMMMVNTEQQVGGYDLNNAYTFHSAEGAMEKMTSDLANTFKSIQSPTAAQVCALDSLYPTWDTTIQYTVYNVAPIVTNNGAPCSATPNNGSNGGNWGGWGLIASGEDANLYAQILPVQMNVTAQRVSGTEESVSMTRTAEVALIPVFQFGVFSDSDLFFGRSPYLVFSGRVHTNGDLYLGVADGYNLVFGDKLAAFGNVIREQMDNGVVSSGNDDGGTVLIPTAANGCATQLANVTTATASSDCVDISTTALGASLGSVDDGHGSAQNTGSWKTVSLGTYSGYLIDGNGNQTTGQSGTNSTGATDLTLPFVNGSSSSAQVQIIRQPLPGESTTSLLGSARLANEASIRILLADTEAGLHPNGSANDANDVYLSSLAPAGFNAIGSTAFSDTGIKVNGKAYNYYFGEAWCGTAAGPGQLCTAHDGNFVEPVSYEGTAWGSIGTTTTAYGGTEWPIIGGWLRVEYMSSITGTWQGVTQEWLGLGFARGVSVPVEPGISSAGVACVPPTTNALPTSGNYTTVLGCNFLADHTNAILYFQQTADRNGDGGVTSAGDADGNNINQNSGAGVTANNLGGADSQYNWYPINFYEAREGENNDTRSTTFPYSTSNANPSVNLTTSAGTPNGTPNGIMNAVELDVGNLRNWLLGKTGSNGPNVNYSTQNGYILYFSDRRGEQVATALANPVCSGCPTGSDAGEYGFEDTVNYAGGAPYMPNNSLEPANYNGVSPEDVNGNLQLDTYGVKYVGDAFGSAPATATDATIPANPFNPRVYTYSVGRANRVTGARHVLKLVDGSMGSLPTMPPGNAINNCSQSAANPTGCGGFTVASENPVYIQGNYNSNCPAVTAGVFSPCTYGNNANLDLTWTGGNDAPHAAASIIADAVTMLSNNWQDAGTLSSTNVPNNTYGSLSNPVLTPNGECGVPACYPGRLATTTYYRVAIAAGKNIAFNNVGQLPEFAFGMDGGVHNFLRFLEDWGGIPTTLGGTGTQAQLYYKGSIVSLYWSMYDTGTFKCCNLVYAPPDRQYVFDSLFSVPTNLPPGTPMFRNVDNLSYRQNQFALTSAP